MSVYEDIMSIVVQLRHIKSRLVKDDDVEIEYRNYVEGILSAAIAALEVGTK